MTIVDLAHHVALCQSHGGAASALIGSFAWVPGHPHPWLPRTAEGELPSSLFTWWEPPDPLALTADECAALLEHRGPERSAEDQEWRCDAWFSEAPAAVTERVEEVVTFANDLWWRLDIDYYTFVVHRYEVGRGHPEHFDMAPGTMTRKLAASIQLSPPDAYEGGDLELLLFGRWHKSPRTQGTVIVIPGWMTHRVQPVTAGERQSLVVMGYGPPLR